jgi:hypothetical protein
MTSTNQQDKRITDKDFIDWESHVFGYGYGTGEQYTIEGLRIFFELCNENTGTAYDHEKLEERMTAPTTWLFINILCKAGIIEYGTSPRHGWLTKAGEMLKDYMLSKTFNELYEMVTNDSGSGCFPDLCQCGTESKKETCNPLFKRENL